MLRVLPLLFLMMLSMSGLADISVVLKKEAIVKKVTFTLGDIAHIDGKGEFSELSQIVIGESARPGYFIDVPIANIKALITKEYPKLLQGVQWHGNQVRVKTQGEKLDISEIESLAFSTLDNWLALRYSSFSLQQVSSIKRIVIPQGSVSFVASVPNTKKADKRMSVWVDVRINGQHYQTYQLWFEVIAREYVYIAKNDISSKTTLSTSLFQRELRDVTVEKGVPVVKPTQLVNHRAAKAIEPGNMLSEALIEHIPLVSKGEKVNVYVYVGNVGIQTKAIALRQGNLDEKISVMNPATQERYLAVVFAAGKVRVQ